MPDIWMEETGTLVNLKPPSGGCPSANADSWEYSVYDGALIDIAEQIRDRYDKPSSHRCPSLDDQDCMFCA